jgi:rhamnogalacturonyl hydrolase YesR
MLRLLALALLASAKELLPPRAEILAGAKHAFDVWAGRPEFNVGPSFDCHEGMECNDCHWTGSTFLLGVLAYHKAAGDPVALNYAKDWASFYDYKVCGRGGTNINHQLSGSVFVELYNLDGNKTHLEDVARVLGKEIADPSTVNYWSWVDLLHMAMSTYSRMGNATGQTAYFDKQYANFNASALAPPDGLNKSDIRNHSTFGFWNKTDELFYRDERFLGTQVYWARGNGWAFAALVSALEYGAGGADPHYAAYLAIFKQLAAKLKSLQPEDGGWRGSLLNVSGYPLPETSGTASFAYGMAWGISNNILDAAEYLPAVAKAWAWLSNAALHTNGTVGYCQPGGDSPANNFNSSTTTNFCVGQFLLAASQVARLAPQ